MNNQQTNNKKDSSYGKSGQEDQQPRVLEASRLFGAMFFGLIREKEEQGVEERTDDVSLHVIVRDRNDNPLPVGHCFVINPGSTPPVSPSSSAPKGSATAISSSPSTSEKEKGSLLMIDPVTALGLNEPVRYDPAELRQTKVYQSTKRLLLWQRDNYLVGTDYADWRQQERSQNVPHHQPPGSAPPPRQSKSGRAAVQTRATTTKTRSTIEDWMANIPYEPYSESSRAMRPLPPSYGHLLSLSVPFIPSLTVRNALLPLLVGLPQHPPIFHWTEEMLANIILSQQTNLDRLVHNVLLNYLTNPNNRRAIKHSTQGYIVRTSVPDQNSNDGQ